MKLTERELAILQALAGGCPTAEIARRLHLSPRAVASARYWLYARLGASNGPHAVAIGLQLGLIKATPAGSPGPAAVAEPAEDDARSASGRDSSAA
jgi:DNA-binding CsgD family transcriptional regulator